MDGRHPPLSPISDTPRDSIISRLPAEVLSFIFIYVIADEWHVIYQNIPPEVIAVPVGEMVGKNQEIYNGRVASPLQLGAICRRWRDISQGTPQLWTSIAIDMGHVSLDARHVTLFKECVTRSGALPLRIKLSVDENYTITADLVEKQHIGDMISAFLASASRVVGLDVRLPEVLLQRLRWSSSDPSRPTVKKMNVFLIPKDGDSTERLNMGAIWDDLTHVALRGLRFHHIDVGWGNLTHVDVRRVTVFDCFNVLRNAPLLTNLIVATVDPRPDEPNTNPAQTITHARLRYFDYVPDVEIGVAILFRYTAMPALEELTVVLYPADHGEAASIIPESFRSTLTSLKKLTVSEYHLYEPEYCESLVTVLRDLPSLEYLYLLMVEEDPSCYDILFEALGSFHASGETGLLLPNLRELKLCFCGEHSSIDNISWDLLPDIFADFPLDDDDIVASEPPVLGRPLLKLLIECSQWPEEFTVAHCIEPDDVRRFVSLMDIGVVLQMGVSRGENYGENFHDVLEYSIALQSGTRTHNAGGSTSTTIQRHQSSGSL